MQFGPLVPFVILIRMKRVADYSYNWLCCGSVNGG